MSARRGWDAARIASERTGQRVGPVGVVEFDIENPNTWHIDDARPCRQCGVQLCGCNVKVEVGEEPEEGVAFEALPMFDDQWAERFERSERTGRHADVDWQVRQGGTWEWAAARMDAGAWIRRPSWRPGTYGFCVARARAGKPGAYRVRFANGKVRSLNVGVRMPTDWEEVDKASAALAPEPLRALTMLTFAPASSPLHAPSGSWLWVDASGQLMSSTTGGRFDAPTKVTLRGVPVMAGPGIYDAPGTRPLTNAELDEVFRGSGSAPRCNTCAGSGEVQYYNGEGMSSGPVKCPGCFEACPDAPETRRVIGCRLTWIRGDQKWVSAELVGGSELTISVRSDGFVAILLGAEGSGIDHTRRLASHVHLDDAMAHVETWARQLSPGPLSIRGQDHD